METCCQIENMEERAGKRKWPVSGKEGIGYKFKMFETHRK